MQLARRFLVAGAKRKEVLAEEAGGRAEDAATTSFSLPFSFIIATPRRRNSALAEAGVTRSLEKCRAEAKKCILLCANCHSAFEAGLIDLPVELWDPPDPE